jgi:8-oxo-dGTP pyrophosphatase MutT (NUDIX family)
MKIRGNKVPEIKTLFETKWLALKKMILAEWGTEYVYVHSVHSDGEAVAVLPHRINDGQIEFLLRKEIVPPWSLELSPCSLTGSHEGGELIDTAVREVKEESGYTVEPEWLTYHGFVRNSKASTTKVHLYSVDLTGIEAGKPDGDGSVLEAMGTYYWTKNPFESEDGILLAMYAHLMRSLQ